MVEQLNYRIFGEKSDVILIHGLFGSMDNLTPVVRGLTDHYRIVSLDLRNHGRSFHRSSMSYPEMAGDVFALMDHLKVDSAIIVGHSMGGKVGMRMALQEPDRVRALVVGDIAPAEYPPHHQNVLNALQAYKPELATSRSGADKQLAAFIEMPTVRQLLIKGLKKDQQGHYVWRMNVEGIIKSYKDICAVPETGEKSYAGPALFVKGENSDYLKPEHRDVIDRLFPAAKLRVITGAGHWLHADKPDLFNATLKRFLASL
ncbi:alpha/beta fold hydrolase [Sansalvadorimonas sp. 2012CJ34-2]|uniref:Alpha/beta fold hydrolase n=1 Tax=Parendozoicomonas callyspongiae TaxID=2942213 RepID=A0ABT0PLB2_9GAMM|nr:alpha/beta fold hydrolase [Sansalvadorimonas sp. 2012CJ34-2]MCL6272172.1 alpha/beta fold hydrolase [Sansalvadorimonas sp. 2012CJ34-2]